MRVLFSTLVETFSHFRHRLTLEYGTSSAQAQTVLYYTMSTIREELNWCDHLLSSPLRKAVLLNNDTNFKNDEINTIYEDGEGLLLKILSWNILAECYTNPRSHPNLPDEYSSVVFNKTKRRSLLFKILKSLAESFDVLCLQELDLYEECVEALDNFDSCHSTVHPRADCCAIFWKKDKFDLVESRTIKFDDLAQVIDREEKERGGTNKAKVDPSDDPRNTPARKQRSTTTGAGGGKPTVTTALNGMVQCFLRRNTASIAVLQQKAIPHHKFAVASTHFYWNPGYEFVKLAQAKFLLDKLHEMVMRNSSSSLHSAGPVSVSTSRSSTHRMPVFVCGDFNTTPGSIVHTFMAQGNVDARTVAPWNSTTTNPSDLLSIDPSASSSSISTVSLSSWNKTKYKNTSNFFHDYDDPTDEMFGNGKFYLFGHHTRFPFSDCSADKIAALTQKLKSGKLIYEGQGQVKYMLDFTLNRLSRWLRILGLDAAVESEREERQRTSCTNKQKMCVLYCFCL
jgi:mRNA deadenylase 3'-5' endonuclease subunit Ccr4